MNKFKCTEEDCQYNNYGHCKWEGHCVNKPIIFNVGEEKENKNGDD